VLINETQTIIDFHNSKLKQQLYQLTKVEMATTMERNILGPCGIDD